MQVSRRTGDLTREHVDAAADSKKPHVRIVLAQSANEEFLLRESQAHEDDGRIVSIQMGLDLADITKRRIEPERRGDGAHHGHAGELAAQSSLGKLRSPRRTADQGDRERLIPGGLGQAHEEIRTSNPLGQRGAGQLGRPDDRHAIRDHELSTANHRRQRGVTAAANQNIDVRGDYPSALAGSGVHDDMSDDLALSDDIEGDAFNL